MKPSETKMDGSPLGLSASYIVPFSHLPPLPSSQSKNLKHNTKT